MLRHTAASLAAAWALVVVATTAHAAPVVFDWAKPDPMDVPNGYPSPNCNGNTDYCGAVLAYTSGGVTVTVTGAASTTVGVAQTGVRVIQDVVGLYGGLGVLTPRETGNLDQVGGGGFLEKLILTFSAPVLVSQLGFYDDHAKNPTFTGHQFSVRVDGFAAITNQQPQLAYNTSLTGTVFEVSNPFATPDRSWYLSGMAVSAVPEPGTYALLLAGLVMLGFMAKRRVG